METTLWNDIVPAPHSISVDSDTEVGFPSRLVVTAKHAGVAAGVCELVRAGLGLDGFSGGGDGEASAARSDFGSGGRGRIRSHAPISVRTGTEEGGTRSRGDECNVSVELESEALSEADPAADIRDCFDERWSLSYRPDESTGVASVRIRAAGYRGAMRAAAAFAQAAGRAIQRSVEGSRDITLPSAELSGAPEYPWRGFMLDCARHMFPVQVVKRLIDEAALHRLNVFHWHLTDDQGWRLPSAAYPDLERVAAWRDDNTTNFGSYGGVYSAAEIRDVVDHAARRGIVVVPEIDIPGHVRAVLSAMPGLSCTGDSLPVPIRHGIFEDVLCAGNPDTHVFLETVFGELCELFPGTFIHLGGDECPSTRWEHCPKCRERAQQLGLPRMELLHGDLVRTAVRTIEAHGRRPVGWDEVLESEPLPGVLIMCWRAHECADRALEAGHDVVLCPTDRACYFDHKPLDDPREPGWLGVCTIRDTYRFRPVLGSGGAAAQSEGGPTVLGSQGNLWTEQVRYGREAEYMLWPRLAALSEVLCGTAGRNGLSGDEDRILRHAAWLRNIDIKSYDGPAG